MPEAIALKVIQQPEPGTRPVMLHEFRGVLFFLGEEHAPALSCGQCGEVLVRGIRLKRFTTLEKAAAMRVKTFPFKDGPQRSTVTHDVPNNIYLAGHSRLVLKCPSCPAYNDTVASSTA